MLDQARQRKMHGRRPKGSTPVRLKASSLVWVRNDGPVVAECDDGGATGNKDDEARVEAWRGRRPQ